MKGGIAPSKLGPWRAIPFSAALILSGCFFDEVRRSEVNDIQRVEQKQATLRAEQDRSAALRQQEEQLATELSDRQLSLNELNERVQQIQSANGLAIDDNDVKRRQYNDLLRELHETNQQFALLQEATAGSIEERRERLAYLKSRVKAQLDRLLH